MPLQTRHRQVVLAGVEGALPPAFGVPRGISGQMKEDQRVPLHGRL